MNFILKGLMACGVLILIGCKGEEQKSFPVYSQTPIMEPELFAPGIVSSDLNEFELGFSADGYTAYFTRRKEGEKQKIYTTTFDGENWGPAVLADFSTDRDETVCITPDGKYLYFASQRPIPGRPNLGGFDMNVWQMTKDSTGHWGNPTALPAPINEVQVEGENWPSSNNNLFFTNDGENFYYTTMLRGDYAMRLFKTTKEGDGFSVPEQIDGFFENDSTWVYSAVITPDNEYLLFNTFEAPGGVGGEDLYASKRTESGWSPARSITVLNTKDEESSARFSRDGKYFFFTRAENLGDYEYGPWNIFIVETAALKLDEMFSDL